jgi:hypothetical protein
MTLAQGCSPQLVQHWRTLTDSQLRIAVETARASVSAFARATEASGSVIQSWVRGQDVVQVDHYPPDDIVDDESGSQFYYRCHRSGGAEHGHLHLFWHATRNGRRRRAPAGTRRWLRIDPSHLFAISLDARGLPRGLFTVNRWVTDGHWFDAPTLLGHVDRFAMRLVEGHQHSCAWITSFVRMYRPVVEELLKQRDRRLAGRRDLSSALDDRELEVLSQIDIDWGADLDALEAEFAARQKAGTARRPRSAAGNSTHP